MASEGLMEIFKQYSFQIDGRLSDRVKHEQTLGERSPIGMSGFDLLPLPQVKKRGYLCLFCDQNGIGIVLKAKASMRLSIFFYYIVCLATSASL